MNDDFNIAVDDADEVIAMSPRAVVWFVFNTLYRPEPDEGPEPQKRARAAVDAGLALAEQRGFKESRLLQRAFMGLDKRCNEFTILDRMFKVISPEEFLSASGVFEALFHTKH